LREFQENNVARALSFAGEQSMAENFTGPVNISGDLNVQSGQVTVDRSGYGNANKQVGGESLIVRHSEDGIFPGVTFLNDGGGHFVQQFVFTNTSSNLPAGVAATFWANWDGLVISGHRNLTFIIGSLGVPGAVPGEFQFNGGNVGIGTIRSDVKLAVAGSEYSDHGAEAGIGITNTGDNGANWYLRVGADSGNGTNYTYTPPGGFSIADDRAYRFVIDNSGNIAIAPPEHWPKGITNPARLEIFGDLKVYGDIFLPNADCAEDFDVSEQATFEPGTVMVIDKEAVLQQCCQPYDKKAAGVISGAGDLKPAITLGRNASANNNKVPLALVGKVYCKVDAQQHAIDVGDLLTTSATPGHAMKAIDPARSFGAVIGKALGSLSSGRGLIPILVGLQ
jgi:hypothetical protein